jgi:hypothetical protein
MGKFRQLIYEWGRRSLGDILLEQFRRLKIWWLTKPPNPWPEELDEVVNQHDCKVICPRCITPQHNQAWFCPKCGAAVVPYNNTMTFLNVFSTGEMLRAGTGTHLKKTPLVMIGYLMVSLVEYLLFAPIFLYRFFRNWYQPVIDEKDNTGENEAPLRPPQ